MMHRTHVFMAEDVAVWVHNRNDDPVVFFQQPLNVRVIIGVKAQLQTKDKRGTLYGIETGLTFVSECFRINIITSRPSP